jgi:hypothetical protein
VPIFRDAASKHPSSRDNGEAVAQGRRLHTPLVILRSALLRARLEGWPRDARVPPWHSDEERTGFDAELSKGRVAARSNATRQTGAANARLDSRPRL